MVRGERTACLFLFMVMLVMTKGQDNTIVVTCDELAVGDGAYYLIRLKRRSTGEVVSVVVSKDDDESTLPSRYNQFTLDSSVIDTTPLGQYVYSIHEQDSNSNTDPTLSLRMVETGWCKIISNDAVNPFKAYEG